MSIEEAVQYLQRLSKSQRESIEILEYLTDNFKQIEQIIETVAQQMLELANRFDDDIR